MFKKNLGSKKVVTISMAIGLSWLGLSSLANLSHAPAHSLSQNYRKNNQKNERNTPANSSDLNQPNPRNSATSNETSDRLENSFFNPPPLGAPKRTADAGARGECPLYIDNNQRLTILIPDSDSVNIAASTVAEHPTLLWYLPQYKNLKSLTFQLYDESLSESNNQDGDRIKPIFQKTIPVDSETTGIMRFQLPESEPPLEIGKWYSWFLFVSSSDDLEDEQTQTNIQQCDMVQGLIGRRSLNSNQQAELNAATNLEELWKFYAQEIIWYDALAISWQMRRSHPDDRSISRKWQAVLGLIGLANLSEYPPVDTGEIDRQNSP